ncbi:N-acetylmuramoyl-L-alanine amidase [Faecalimicrobium dakarense]|uniref:N-acetylmuramoyl-L-alanine amidase n=1 Tax=Faecalimicrobium dakarense TaxID=1301100 RepID=UPI0004B9BDEB|nr:N-acetylmuramoyl-L-alanine amidase [[Clostridium] dakarense]
MSGRKNSNNNRRKKVKPKKRKLNRKKIMLLICFLGLFIFGITKLKPEVSQAIKNKDDKPTATQENIKVEEKQFELSDEKKESLEKKYTILVDPGHGGHDKGTQDGTRKIYEKDVALEIGKKVAAKLSKQSDVQVIISRTEDKFISLDDRVKMANVQNVDALVSIHLNAEGGGSSANGVETYYRTGANDGSDKLANRIQETIASYIAIKDRGTREDIYKVIKDARMPAVLVECGFLTNPKESKKLLSEKYQNQLADGISQGVLSFLDEQSKHTKKLTLYKVSFF